MKPLSIRLRTGKVGFPMKLFESMVSRNYLSSTVICSSFGSLRDFCIRIGQEMKVNESPGQRKHLNDTCLMAQKSLLMIKLERPQSVSKLKLFVLPFFSCLLIPASKTQLIS